MTPLKVWAFFRFDQLIGIALNEPKSCEGGREMLLVDPETHDVEMKLEHALWNLCEAVASGWRRLRLMRRGD